MNRQLEHVEALATDSPPFMAPPYPFSKLNVLGQCETLHVTLLVQLRDIDGHG
jgi:hypothetical protein